MPRVARAGFARVPHHLTQRGNRRAAVFFTDADRRCYLEWLSEYGRLHGLEILADCLMTNHVHVVGVPAEDDSLQRTLEPLHMRYAQRINRRRRWTRHLWQGRARVNKNSRPRCFPCFPLLEQQQEILDHAR